LSRASRSKAGHVSDDVERLQDRRKHAIELDEEPSVGVAQPNSAAALPLQDNHRLAEHRNLGVKARLLCERPDQDCENEPEKPDHPVSLRDSLSSSTERGFRHTQSSMPFDKAGDANKQAGPASFLASPRISGV